MTKKTAEVSVYIQEVTVKVLDEVAVNEFSGTTETYDRVKLNYTVKQGWNTIAVPFMISDLSVFGENVQAYLFSDYADGELKFSRTTQIPAATPCVFYTEAPSTKQITFNSVTIYSYNAVEEDCAVTKNEATFQGTYAPIAAPGMQGKYGVVPSTGKIRPSWKKKVTQLLSRVLKTSISRMQRCLTSVVARLSVRRRLVSTS